MLPICHKILPKLYKMFSILSSLTVICYPCCCFKGKVELHGWANIVRCDKLQNKNKSNNGFLTRLLDQITILVLVYIIKGDEDT